MLEPIPDLSQARILVTNDDGYDAEGIRVLERIALSLSGDVWVVAPASEQSAASHSLTLRRPLHIERKGRRHFTVDGTPTDCVLVACHHILKDRWPDLVLSGINLGANLAEDVLYSGTVAAAMEGAVLGVRAIAMSQARMPDGSLDFSGAERRGPAIVKALCDLTWRRETLMNVNFPAVTVEGMGPVRVVKLGRRGSGTEIVEGVSPGGHPHIWIGQYLTDETSGENTDQTVVGEGGIAVTPLYLDMTDVAGIESTAKAFGEKITL
ncbi:MAG: 5'/3'-nucleotidase SurE [Rhodospirillales bacterium]|nr:5'/3'-nucleotidase SurE [Rhodospirillales bacterium]